MHYVLMFYSSLLQGRFWYVLSKKSSPSRLQVEMQAGVYVTNLSDIMVRSLFARRVSSLCGPRRPILRVVLPVIIIIFSIVVFGIKRTDSILKIMMAFSINTGLLTSICAVACLVTYAIWPQRFIFMGLYFALSKLYVNSLLASLNARHSLSRRDRADSTDCDVGRTPIVFPMHMQSTFSTTKEDNTLQHTFSTP
ncbi:hypothetical protein JR316_0012077 [Psilocybe cubensis]|uniref:Uncharacterized protein n=1 Tax=Psilocybe cubensis TaxID=181762 RepID=A0ACB8GH05_PSICU|nr:hypothetical protein JR316_0012077 [Psilocybe cubensis]KAH9474978.1 hypothetical protein JR316_0012077 [Psilocybe cubensis]